MLRLACLLTYLFSYDAGGVVDEMSESDAVDASSSQPESGLTVSFDGHKPPLASDDSVADHSPQPVSHDSPTLVAGIERLMPYDAASDVATAMTSCVLASDAIRRRSQSPADRSSSNPTEMADKEENKAESESPAVSGISIYLFICIRPRGSITHQQLKHTQTHPEYLKHMHTPTHTQKP